MNDSIKLQPRSEQKLEHLLKHSFQPSQSLTDDFEMRVMASIHQQKELSKSGRAVFIAMMFYWAFASLMGAWLLSNSPLPLPGENSGSMLIVLAIVGMVATGLLLLVRQSGLSLSSLFLRTIHRP